MTPIRVFNVMLEASVGHVRVDGELGRATPSKSHLFCWSNQCLEIYHRQLTVLTQSTDNVF